MKSSSKSIRFVINTTIVTMVLMILVVGLVSASNFTAVKNDFTKGSEEDFAPVPSIQIATDKLLAASNGTAEVAINRATGFARFVSFPQGLNGFAVAEGRQVSAEKQANAFLANHGDLFGLSDAASQLAYVDTLVDNYGFTHVNYVETRNGVEVFASTMRIHFNNEGALTAVNGTVIPGIKVSSQPKLTPEQASDIAIAEVQRQQAANASVDSLTDSRLAVVENTLYFYHTGLLQSIPGEIVLAYEVEVSNGRDIREFVFVDANTGDIVEQFSGIHEGAGADREISETSLANVVWDESAGNPDPITAGWAGGTAQQVTDWQNEIDGSKEIYNTIDNLTGGTYASYDGAEATMRTVNNDPGISCPNANWNGVSTNYCTDVTGDDTVAHEWGHAYTEYTHNLIYAWQPGALNESYSDIWGEVVDLINGRGIDAPDVTRMSNTCSSNVAGANFPGNPTVDTVRWLSGEDDPAFFNIPAGSGNAIRDMWDPTCFGDPGKVSDTQYYCAATDGGGVHTNSGVPNHAFALLVDGGAYNGQTISGIGLDKAAYIYWRSQYIYQSPTSDFADHASALAQSCTDLIDVPLTALSSVYSTAVPTGSITAGDCAELDKVITAVEFNTPPTQCSFEPAFVAAPPLCENQGTGVVNSIYTQNWEVNANGWVTGTHNIANPASFTNPDWVVRASLPDGRSGSAMFVEDSVNRGACTVADTVAGALNLDSPVFIVPAGVTTPRVAIDHLVATESGWDGGNVKISVNGGAWTVLPNSAFEVNGYFAPGVLNSVGAGNDNPLAGQAAFTGGGQGSVSTGWGQSQLNLSDYVIPGDEFQLRFDMGLDGCNGVDGWYVDDFEVYSCEGEGNPSLDVPEITVAPVDLSSTQGENKQITQTLTISNVGQLDLDWTIEEAAAAASPLFAPVVKLDTNSRGGSKADTTPPVVYTPNADFSEGFEDITNLPGWATQNNSDSPGSTTWFQGNDTVFSAHAGATTSYIAANYNNTAGSQISNWLMTPEVTFTGESQISFWTRTGEGSSFPDRLQVRVSTSGASTDVGTTPSSVGDFTNLELDINETLSVGGYPEVWTQYTIDLSAYAGQSGRVAFHYYVPNDAGPSGTSSNYIGIDTVEFIEGDPGPCSSPSDIAWVSVNPNSGSIAPATASNIDVVFDSTGMANGVYTGTLCINSNDPVTPRVEVPLTMTVEQYFIYLPFIVKE